MKYLVTDCTGSSIAVDSLGDAATLMDIFTRSTPVTYSYTDGKYRYSKGTIYSQPKIEVLDADQWDYVPTVKEEEVNLDGNTEL